MIQSYNIELDVETYIGEDGLLKFQVDKDIHREIKSYLEENYNNDAELLKTNGKVY